MDNKNLNSFLKFGYFFAYENSRIKFDFTGVDKKRYIDVDEEELIELGSEYWRSSISKSFELNKKNVVPISGGLDSRAILAAMLEHAEASNINTYTFGTPGTLDYDIGNYIAKKIGTKHTKLPLTDYQYSVEDEIEVSRRIDHQTFLFRHPPLKELDELYPSYLIWSGFIIDWVAGSHLPLCKAKVFSDAKVKAFDSGAFVRSVDLTNMSREELVDVFNCDVFDSDILSYEEQIEANHHLVKYTAPHILYKGFEYKTPVMFKKFFDFFLSIDDKYRHNECLYKKILLKSFPKEFSYKTKTNFGLPLGAGKNAIFLKRVHNKFLRTIGLTRSAGINYLDFNEKIREKLDLREIIISSINDLEKRDVVDWVDIGLILKSHLSGRGNYADALIVLASLEIHLKSGLEL